MSRKRLIYVGLLGIAAVAFLADRILFNHPQEAEAVPAEEPLRPRSIVSAKPAQPKAPVLDPSLAWLEKLTDIGMGHDAFSPVPAWMRSKQAKEDSENIEALGPSPGSPEAFEDSHQLQATSVMERGSLAVVNQRCLRVGDMLDGFRLERVEPSVAEFRKGSETALLILPMPPEQVLASRAKQPTASTDEPKQPAPATRPALSFDRLLDFLVKPQH